MFLVNFIACEANQSNSFETVQQEQKPFCFQLLVIRAVSLTIWYQDCLFFQMNQPIIGSFIKNL